MKKLRWQFFIFCFALCAVQCTRQSVAGGSDNPDFKVAGIVRDSLDLPAPRTEVTLVPVDYNPVSTIASKEFSKDTTDSNGRYILPTNIAGEYNVEAVHIENRTRGQLWKVKVGDGDNVTATSVTLHAPGTIKFDNLQQLDTINGYFYIPGTSFFKMIQGNAVSVVFDSIPAGTIPQIRYATVNGLQSRLVRQSYTVGSGTRSIVSNPWWQYSRSFILNTTPTGASVIQDIYNFPLLVRLTKDNFDFSLAQKNGADFMIQKPSGKKLPFEIARWDSTMSQAELWVKIDTVLGNNATQMVNMYWGTTNNDSAIVTKDKTVFDTAEGFCGVWHLDESGNQVALDATANHYNGDPYNMTELSSGAGVIGLARQFDGRSTYLNMMNTASGKLNFQQNGTFAISAWVKTDTLNGKYQVIASKGDFQYNLEIMDVGKWELTDFHDTTGWYESLSPASAQTWTYVVGMHVGDKQYLYVNGVCVDDTLVLNAIKPTLTTRYRVTTNNFMVGKRVDFTEYYFAGFIDELRVSNRELSADWIKLCYMNQRVDDKLIEFK